MTAETFYTPEEISEKLPSVIPVFISAFAGEPWYEVSKCADDMRIQRCASGLSAVAVGELCNVCEIAPSSPAYTYDEVKESFDEYAQGPPTVWYTEEIETGLALAGFASREQRQTLMKGVYRKSPDMDAWLGAKIGDQEIAWVHEVFADHSRRSKGNLVNFRSMCEGFSERLDTASLAYCTINPRMVSAAVRSFGDSAVRVYEKQKDVPDWRYFVHIDME